MGTLFLQCIEQGNGHLSTVQVLLQTCEAQNLDSTSHSHHSSQINLCPHNFCILLQAFDHQDTLQIA